MAKTKLEIEQENNELKTKLLQMEENIQKLLKNSAISTPQEEKRPTSFDVNVKKQVIIMSLYNGILNLCTEEGGKGRIYTFTKFGETKPIPFEHLNDIINACRRFFTEGFAYILDEEIIVMNGLQEYYDNNLVSKEIIESILELPNNEIDNILQKVSQQQKEVICNLIIEKILNKEEVNSGKIDVVNRILQIDLFEKARESEELLDLNKKK